MYARPDMDPLKAELCDTWLIPNGIAGWIPEGSTIVVFDGQILWPQWRHRLPGGNPWDSDDLLVVFDLYPPRTGLEPGDGNKPIVELRTVPLQVPVTDRVRELFSQTTGLRLVESERISGRVSG